MQNHPIKRHRSTPYRKFFAACLHPKNRVPSISRFLWLGMLALLMLPLPLQAQSRTFSEEFGFGDRQQALGQLIPGTEDHYYYSALHALNQGDFDLDRDLEAWKSKFGHTQRLREIENRLHLLRVSSQPDKSWKFIQERLNLSFAHPAPKSQGEVKHINQVKREFFDLAQNDQRLLKSTHGLNGFEDAALPRLGQLELDGNQRREWLNRLEYHPSDRLMVHLEQEIRSRNLNALFNYPIHQQLTLAQLHRLQQKWPDYLNMPSFVNLVFNRLKRDPNQLRYRPEEYQRYLDSLWNFAEKLPAGQNSLKAHVLFHLLEWHRQRDEYHHALVLTYLNLPRQVSYLAREFQYKNRTVQANLNLPFQNLTGLQPIAQDEALVRHFLFEMLKRGRSLNPLSEVLDAGWLEQLTAEFHILHDENPDQKWFEQLPASLQRELRERTVLHLAADNLDYYQADQEVELKVETKNVQKMLIRIYQIDSFNVFRSTQQPVQLDLDLSGLEPNYERTLELTQSPFRQLKHSLPLPELSQPGNYVVDLVGNGLNSRALIRKGRLLHHVEPTPEGLLVRVFAETGQLQSKATFWLASNQFTANSNGEILIPYSRDPGVTSAILSAGERTELIEFDHQGANYELQAGFFATQESLIPGRTSEVLLRAQLGLNGTPVELKRLLDPKVDIVVTNQDGVIIRESRKLKPLADNTETLIAFRLPERTKTMELQLSGWLNDPWGQKQLLNSRHQVQLTPQHAPFQVGDFHLQADESRSILYLRGKNGEPLPNVEVSLRFKHRDYKEWLQTTAETDSKGQISLEMTDDVLQIQASTPDGIDWQQQRSHRLGLWPNHFVAQATEPITLPRLQAFEFNELNYSLLALNDGVVTQDYFSHLRQEDNHWVISSLPVGQYLLINQRLGQRLPITILEGETNAELVVNENSVREQSPRFQSHLKQVSWKGKRLRIRFAEMAPNLRVHAITSQFEPVAESWRNLSFPPAQEYGLTQAPNYSEFQSQRKIGDEWQYILTRRQSQKFPGNPLSLPRLLVNPQEVGKAASQEQPALTGQAFSTTSPPAANRLGRHALSPSDRYALTQGRDLEWLNHTARILANLQPEANGVLELEHEWLGELDQLSLIMVDGHSVQYRTLTKDAKPPKTKDIRLTAAMEPAKHLKLHNSILPKQTGQPQTIPTPAGTEVRVYESWGDVFDLMRLLRPSTSWDEFEVLKQWDQYDTAAKESHYSKLASHEMHWFLLLKDPEFFKRTVLSAIAEKKDKTFLDHWFLGEDLRAYTQFWRFRQLNRLEQILLSQRLNSLQVDVRKMLTEQLEVTPSNPEQDFQRFMTALYSSRLDQQAVSSPQLSTLAAPSSQTSSMKPNKQGESRRLKRSSMEAFDAEMLLEAAAPMMADMADEAEELAEVDGDQPRQPKLFQPVEKTKVFIEANYYRQPLGQASTDLFSVNPFWLEFAEKAKVAPLLSEHFLSSVGTFTEAFFALALVDLPFSAQPNAVQFEEQQLKLAKDSQVLVFLRSLQETEAQKANRPLFAQQVYFDPHNRFERVKGVRVEKTLDDGFVTGKPYGVKLVLSNPLALERRLEVLTQVPQGAVPLNQGAYTRSRPLTLGANQTKVLEYTFYFPRAGRFAHYPVQVFEQERLVTSGKPFEFEVSPANQQQDTSSWNWISHFGKPADVLKYLSVHNPHDLDLDRIAFRMKDRGLFEKTLKILGNKGFYHSTLWSYAVYHRDPQQAKSFLEHSELATSSGWWLQSPLLEIDPGERQYYHFIELFPYIQARTHRFGKPGEIPNERLQQQYDALLKRLSYQPRLHGEDRLVLAYYLVLQNRFGEAIEQFGKIESDHNVPLLPYDYLKAWLAVLQNKPQIALELASEYAAYPVKHWRERFQQIRSDLQAVTSEPTDAKNAMQFNRQALAQTPQFSFTVLPEQLQIQSRHVQQCTVRYFRTDLENLFSQEPFAEVSEQFTPTIRAHLTQSVELSQPEQTVAIPEEFQHNNSLIEVRCHGLQQVLRYPHNHMNIQWFETLGWLQVNDQRSGEAKPQVYVKVYAKLKNGSETFYKDGYTDLLGRFDYVSLSLDMLSQVERFSILVIDQELGAVRKQAAPPKS